MGNYSSSFLSETIAVAASLKSEQVEKISRVGAGKKNKGRVFCLGVGKRANASHAANDLRKITAIESYADGQCVGTDCRIMTRAGKRF